MNTRTGLLAAVGVLFALGAAAPGWAQHPKGHPKKEAHEAKEARKEAKEARKEAKEARAEGAPDAAEKSKEAREKTKEAKEETKEAIEARRKRHRELHDLLHKGPLGEKERAELAAIRARLREVHHEAVDRWQRQHATLVERRRELRKAFHDKWGDLHKRPKVRAELELHARRVARLQRAKYLAEINERDELSERLDKALAREDARFQHRMDVLKGEKP
jgi:hypothetical protein